MEERLSQMRPDLLPGAEDYESVLRATLNHDDHDPMFQRNSFKARA